MSLLVTHDAVILARDVAVVLFVMNVAVLLVMDVALLLMMDVAVILVMDVAVASSQGSREGGNIPHSCGGARASLRAPRLIVIKGP